MKTIDTDALFLVTGGTSFNFKFPTLPSLPWWVNPKPFKIPAADPPGHTKQYQQPR